MKPRNFETILTAAQVAAFLCVLGLAWAAVADDHKVVELIAQTEYRAELAAASLCGEEGAIAVWNDRQEIECLKEKP